MWRRDGREVCGEGMGGLEGRGVLIRMMAHLCCVGPGIMDWWWGCGLPAGLQCLHS